MRILWLDEAIFHMDGRVNKQLNRIWAQQNPKAKWELKMKSQGVSVLAGVYSGGIIGPFFFKKIEKKQLLFDTVNGKNYLDVMKKLVTPAFRRIPDHQNYFVMMDGAPAHWSSDVRNYCNATFGNM